MPVSTTTGVKVRKTHFRYGNTDYFRRDASLVRLVSWGRKLTPIAGVNGLDVQSHIPASRFHVIKATKVAIEFDQHSARDLTADLKPEQIEFAGATMEETRELASEGKLKLLLLQVLPEDLKREINGNARVLNALKDAPNDMRVAHRIWIVMKAALADTVDTSSAGSIAATVDGITLGVKGSGNGQSNTQLEIRPNATFAYALGKLKWDANRKSKRTRVERIDLDDWGGSG